MNMAHSFGFCKGRGANKIEGASEQTFPDTDASGYRRVGSAFLMSENCRVCAHTNLGSNY